MTSTPSNPFNGTLGTCVILGIGLYSKLFIIIIIIINNNSSGIGGYGNGGQYIRNRGLRQWRAIVHEYHCGVVINNMQLLTN